ncbi:MAG: tetratricopeptide repeat protein, partial [Candidatus Eisenbacteria bacterium]|nr:tetratricopeptide repeat protein [Candidatus Eisenbacteria bacterium]
YNKGRFAEAVPLFEEALQQLQDSPQPYGELARFYRVEALVRSGLAKEIQGDPSGAESDLREAVKTPTTFPDYHFHLGRLLARRNDFEGALIRLSEALRLNPRYDEALGWLALVLWKMDRVEEAFAELAKLDEGSTDLAIGRPENPRAEDVPSWFEQFETRLNHFRDSANQTQAALIAYAEGEKDQALQHFLGAVEKHPTYPDLRCRLSILLQENGRYGEAIEHLNKSLEINPRYVEAYLQKGITYLRWNSPDQALPPLSEVLRLEPHYQDAVLLKALACIRIYRVKEARQLLNGYLEWLPGEPRAQYLLAGCLALTRNMGSAREVLEQSARHFSLVAALTDLGWWHLRDRKNADALEIARRGLQNHPGDERLRLLEGMAQLGLGTAEAARGILDELANAARREVARIAVQAIVTLDLKEGRIENGLQILESAKARFPSSFQMTYLRGLLLEEEGELETAEQSYHSAASFLSTDPRLLRDLGCVQIRLGKIEEGLKCWADAYLIDPFAFPSAILGDVALVEEL